MKKNENIFLFLVSSLRQDCWYLTKINLSKNTHFTYKTINILISIGYATPGHILNGYKLNTTNYRSFNMEDFIYWLPTFFVNYFGQVVSPLCIVLYTIHVGWCAKRPCWKPFHSRLQMVADMDWSCCKTSLFIHTHNQFDQLLYTYWSKIKLITLICI